MSPKDPHLLEKVVGEKIENGVMQDMQKTMQVEKKYRLEAKWKSWNWTAWLGDPRQVDHSILAGWLSP